MHRRRCLRASLSVLTGLAGCIGTGVEGRDGPDETGAGPGTPPELCERDPAEVGINEVVDPAFGPDWDGVGADDLYDTLTGSDIVIGVHRAGRARAYPLTILWYHEIVNDDFGGPLLVTYCPLCRSGMVAERLVDGMPTIFRVSGLLWQPDDVQVDRARSAGRVFGARPLFGEADLVKDGNLVMLDDLTGSYWSQLLAEAVCGSQRGEALPIVPSMVVRWEDWRAEHPSTDVLLPPPASGTA